MWETDQAGNYSIGKMVGHHRQTKFTNVNTKFIDGNMLKEVDFHFIVTNT